MRASYKVSPFLLVCVSLLLALGPRSSAAQDQPVAIENADLWGHYIKPLKIIHSQDAETREFGASVILDVVVSIGGNVESAHAIDGTRKFFAEAEAIEGDRQFKPFEQDGIPVRARIRDWVAIAPHEQ